ncbi:MAG: hypothetical protein J7619_07550 [Dyadobacter sp.]|uniref:hypothetical protein n=1 Tax=Dyadobacter sp. TaxID=1914288 RepID=UPI001B051E8B|nr:hypothetical protein [Dyadobacter sp.]MBO9612532.1 hypothetical protein [Dyadobacter sp.]
MYDLYLSIKDSILTQFPGSNVLLEIPPGVTPNVFESTISVDWSPPTLFQISNSQFGDNPDALFISLFPVIYIDQKGKCCPIDYFTRNEVEFTDEGGRSLSIVKMEATDQYRLVLIDFASKDADIVESFACGAEIISQLIDILSVQDTGRPY